jgi:hypothetical protein
MINPQCQNRGVGGSPGTRHYRRRRVAIVDDLTIVSGFAPYKVKLLW